MNHYSETHGVSMLLNALIKGDPQTVRLASTKSEQVSPNPVLTRRSIRFIKQRTEKTF